ncbi:MAG: hypothetical protein U0872_08305 [Planctomycetaceae bacterium]
MTGETPILHDREWTYSVTVPAGRDLYRHPEELYDLVHDAIISVLGGTESGLRRRGETTRSIEEPPLCFSRRDSHDVVVGDYKVLGSAQRRRKGAILQHGSLLLRASSLTPEHRGLEDLPPFHRPPVLEELRRVPERLAGTSGSPLTSGENRTGKPGDRVRAMTPATRHANHRS